MSGVMVDPGPVIPIDLIGPHADCLRRPTVLRTTRPMEWGFGDIVTYRVYCPKCGLPQEGEPPSMAHPHVVTTARIGLGMGEEQAHDTRLGAMLSAICAWNLHYALQVVYPFRMSDLRKILGV